MDEFEEYAMQLEGNIITDELKQREVEEKKRKGKIQIG